MTYINRKEGPQRLLIIYRLGGGDREGVEWIWLRHDTIYPIPYKAL